VSAGPHLVKPNEHELREWARAEGLGSGRGEAALRRYAVELSRRTRGWVLVSRGARPGWLIHAARKVHLAASPPSVRPQHTIGAGDALLAAAAKALLDQRSPAELLATALAIGSLATQFPAGTLPAAAPPASFAGH
jgi:1-phosphofructokinase